MSYLHLTSMLLTLSLSSSAASSADTITSQCSSLLRSFPSSTPPTWRPGTDCCRHGWDGVTCSPSTSLITSLDLAGRNLSGPIGSSLFDITSLESLNLAYNKFDTIPIPSSGFENFPNLNRLNLSNSYFSGQIPLGISRLTNLVSLDLSSNNLLQLNNPNFEMLVQNLFSLEQLYLDGVNISESVGRLAPVLAKAAPRIKVLSLSNCSLSGPIDSSLSKLSALSVLDLSFNQLNSPVPEFLANFSSLTELQLANSGLRGLFPTDIFRIKSLTRIDLSGNSMLSGSLPDFAQGSGLESLLLPFTNFSGNLPSSIGHLKSLKTLDLSYNDFNGTIETDWFRDLKNLSHIDLSYNSLSVQVGDGNSSLPYPTLDGLGLASCNLTQVPSFLRYQYQMDVLDLSCNRIGGAIPNWIWGIGGDFGVQILNLSHNQFTSVEGPLPTFSKHSTKILDLHSNLLQGPIPIPTTNTTSLDYSNNNFSSIPTNISLYLTSTEFFSLANNSIAGEIPPSICEARHLKVLDFADNIFSGPIPPCLLEIGNGQCVLNLRNNRLQWTLPWNISRSCELRTLILNGNRLEGRIPPSLTKCDGLEVLDLGNNRIADSFPHWLSSIPSLRVLILSSNELYGPIIGPTDHYTFPMLQILDLSSNHFNGILPMDFFKGLKGMMVDSSLNYSSLKTSVGFTSSYYYYAVTIVFKGVECPLVRILTTFTAIDLSDNGFTGNIPELIGELRYLHMLNLSQNALTGQIPASIEKMIQLESLDLSRNRLSGKIPQGLVSLNFLAVLNLSDNKLVGRIPQGIQLCTFSYASYQGNEGLSWVSFQKQCGSASPPITSGGSPLLRSINSDDDDSTYVIGLALFTGLGYGVGIALVFVFQNVSLRRRERHG